MTLLVYAMTWSLNANSMVQIDQPCGVVTNDMQN